MKAIITARIKGRRLIKRNVELPFMPHTGQILYIRVGENKTGLRVVEVSWYEDGDSSEGHIGIDTEPYGVQSDFDVKDSGWEYLS